SEFLSAPLPERSCGYTAPTSSRPTSREHARQAASNWRLHSSSRTTPACRTEKGRGDQRLSPSLLTRQRRPAPERPSAFSAAHLKIERVHLIICTFLNESCYLLSCVIILHP